MLLNRITCLFILLFFLSCEKLPTSENPYADLPIAIMMDAPYVEGSSVDLFWESNGLATEYSYWLEPLSYPEPVSPYLLESDWTTENTLTLNDLDDGDYNFFVKARNDQMEPADSLALSINFTISAIEGTALRIYPIKQFVQEGESFKIYIYAENIQNGDIAGSQIELHFNPMLLEYIEDINNCGTDNDIFCPQLNEGRMTIVNWNINGEFDGNTPLAHLSFNKIGNELADTIFVLSESILRNGNNEDIQIDSFYNGRIEVGE